MLDLQPDTKYLITLDHWFYAPNGSQYNAVWGTVELPVGYAVKYAENPTIVVGKNGSEISIISSRMLTAIRCERRPYTDFGQNDKFENGHNYEYTTSTRIYSAE